MIELTDIIKAIYSKFTSIPQFWELEVAGAIGDHAIGVPDTSFPTDIVHNDFYLAVNGQLFQNRAPEDAVYPYSVYSIDSGRTEYNFSDQYLDLQLNLFIYSDVMDSSIIKTLYRKAISLFDEQVLSILTSILIWMREEDVFSRIIEHVTKSGVKRVREYHIQFALYASLK